MEPGRQPTRHLGGRPGWRKAVAKCMETPCLFNCRKATVGVKALGGKAGKRVEPPWWQVLVSGLAHLWVGGREVRPGWALGYNP